MIKIIQGDITKMKVDAIVNAANPAMLGGGGVDGAIHKAAGPALLDACRKVPAINGVRCPTGEARITRAGKLPAKFVIHTVGPVYAREQDPAALLGLAYSNSLKLALENHCKSIAFPAISCGVYGYPHRAAARVALGVCLGIEDGAIGIEFCLFGQAIYEVWQDELGKL